MMYGGASAGLFRSYLLRPLRALHMLGHVATSRPFTRATWLFLVALSLCAGVLSGGCDSAELDRRIADMSARIDAGEAAISAATPAVEALPANTAAKANADSDLAAMRATVEALKAARGKLEAFKDTAAASAADPTTNAIAGIVGSFFGPAGAVIATQAVALIGLGVTTFKRGRVLAEALGIIKAKSADLDKAKADAATADEIAAGRQADIVQIVRSIDALKHVSPTIAQAFKDHAPLIDTVQGSLAKGAVDLAQEGKL